MVTIKDIAEALNITPSTVSRALAGSSRVKAATRIAVQKKADELGYERNIVASNLRKGQSNIVGIIVPRIHREFFANVIAGADDTLREAGYNLLICQTWEEPDLEIKALKALRNYRVAAVLMSHSIRSSSGAAIPGILRDTPLVQFDRVFQDLPGAKVVSNNFDGSREGTRHLIRMGYKRIGTLAGYKTSQVYTDRLAGYRRALEEAGLPYDPSIVFPEVILRETGREAALKALKAGCDALYSAGDFSALGAVEALKEQGVRIPEDFGIVGTANEFFTTLMTPSLSSLGQHPYEMGVAAAKAFLDGRSDTQVIPMELHIRQSSNKNNSWQK